MTIDKRFALIGKDGDVMFPYMKSEKRRNLFGFALSEPGKRDALGMGVYTQDIADVISKVVNHQWSVRVKSAKRPGNSLGLKKNEIIGYWIDPELTYLISNSDTQPLSYETFKSLTGKVFPDILDAKATSNQELTKTLPECENQEEIEKLNEGQGYESDPLVRKAIEVYAVSMARTFYESKGYTVQEIGKPYDLNCVKDEEIIHVEVKGSRNELQHIILTVNEVIHARDIGIRTDLFVVDCIQISANNRTDINARAGRMRLKEDWSPIESELKPIQFRCTLPSMIGIS